MNCKYCGEELREENGICERCGSANEQIKKDILTNDPEREQRKGSLESRSLGFAIAAIAVSAFGFLFSFVGIFLAIKAKSIVKAYTSEFGPVRMRTRVARDLSTAAIIVGATWGVFWLLYFAAIIFLVVAAILGIVS